MVAVALRDEEVVQADCLELGDRRLARQDSEDTSMPELGRGVDFVVAPIDHNLVGHLSAEGIEVRHEREAYVLVGTELADMPASRPPVGGDLQRFHPCMALAMAKVTACCYWMSRAYQERPRMRRASHDFRKG